MCSCFGFFAPTFLWSASIASWHSPSIHGPVETVLLKIQPRCPFRFQCYAPVAMDAVNIVALRVDPFRLAA